MVIFERDNWQEIYATIKKNKLRTFLTMLGVGWGIFMLVFMLGCGGGLRNGVMRNFSGLAVNSMFIWSQSTTKPYKGLKAGRFFLYNNADITSLRQVNEADVICPRLILDGFRQNSNIVRGLKSGSFQCVGDFPEVFKLVRFNLAKGRLLNQKDISDNRKVCVIGKRVAEVLFERNENPLGKYIRISGVYFMVVGVTAPVMSGQEGQEQAQLINVPFTTFQRTFNAKDKVHVFICKAKEGYEAKEAEEKIVSVLKQNHKVAPDDKVAIGHWNAGSEYDRVQGLFTGINWLIWVVGVGTLLAGVIGISNIMLIVIKERTKEIGVKRALGATPANIIWQILMEATVLTTIAGYAGLAGGVFLLEGVSALVGDNTEAMFTNPTVDLTVALWALTVIIAGGLVAGIIPARRAVSIHPVEALRTE